MRKPKKNTLSFGKETHHFDFQMLRTILVWMLQIGIVCMAAFVLVWYFGQRVSNIGESMKPVLYNGDIVLVNRIVYNASSPKRNDIIVFKPNGNENSHYYVKRIIGLPGESIEIKEGEVYVNGERLKEDYKTTPADEPGVAGEAVTLASDEYFVLGDNRKSSEDSRMADVGNVKNSEIYGKAWFTIAPRNHFGFIDQ